MTRSLTTPTSPPVPRANLGQAILLYAGGLGILYGDLTLGEWQKFSLYLVLLFFPIGQLGLIITQMNQASASAIRIFEILDAPDGVADKPGAPMARTSSSVCREGGSGNSQTVAVTFMGGIWGG